jgi:hypothetical protein
MINWLKKAWKREQERRRQNKQRGDNLTATKSIFDRQQAGTITPWQASEEFDEQIMKAGGGLVYYSDSTGLTAPWDPDVMLLAAVGSTPENRIESNQGICVRGPLRGYLILRSDGVTPPPDPKMLEHFAPGIKARVTYEAYLKDKAARL